MSLSTGMHPDEGQPTTPIELRAYIDETHQVLVTRPGGGGRRQQCLTPEQAEAVAVFEAQMLAEQYGHIALTIEKRLTVRPPATAV